MPGTTSSHPHFRPQIKRAVSREIIRTAQALAQKSMGMLSTDSLLEPLEGNIVLCVRTDRDGALPQVALLDNTIPHHRAMIFQYQVTIPFSGIVEDGIERMVVILLSIDCRADLVGRAFRSMVESGFTERGILEWEGAVRQVSHQVNLACALRDRSFEADA